SLINTSKTIRIPAYMVELLSKWRRANARLMETLGRNGTDEEVARLLGVERRKLPMIRKAIHVQSSAPQSDHHENGWSLSDVVSDERVRTPEANLVKADALNHVMNSLKDMNPRDALILEMRFGLNGQQPHTLKEIGKRLGITRERVRQIEIESLTQLGDELKAPRERRYFKKTVA
ncbi:MAG: RNA polymerase sigma factor RpoD/SigA, partial [Pirellulaceae bacterium]|nr:RNA polymerase sigma factor RpoD/SigA [Pirellulaceae bacterium]